MSDSLLVEQSTKLIGQIIDDYDCLKEEFLALNIEEVLEKKPALFSGMVLTALNNIKYDSQRAYTFLESMRLAIKEGEE